MFERYTPEARRLIFFAWVEASQFGSPKTETEHLLLGLVRENLSLVNRFLSAEASEDSIRTRILASATKRESIPAHLIDKSFADESNRVLAFA